MDNKPSMQTLIAGSRELNRMKDEIRTIFSIVLTALNGHRRLESYDSEIKIFIENKIWEFRRLDNAKLHIFLWEEQSPLSARLLYNNNCHVTDTKKVYDAIPGLLERLYEDTRFDFSVTFKPYIEAAPKS